MKKVYSEIKKFDVDGKNDIINSYNITEINLLKEISKNLLLGDEEFYFSHSYLNDDKVYTENKEDEIFFNLTTYAVEKEYLISGEEQDIIKVDFSMNDEVHELELTYCNKEIEIEIWNKTQLEIAYDDMIVSDKDIVEVFFEVIDKIEEFVK